MPIIYAILCFLYAYSILNPEPFGVTYYLEDGTCVVHEWGTSIICVLWVVLMAFSLRKLVGHSLKNSCFIRVCWIFSVLKLSLLANMFLRVLFSSKNDFSFLYSDLSVWEHSLGCFLYLASLCMFIFILWRYFNNCVVNSYIGLTGVCLYGLYGFGIFMDILLGTFITYDHVYYYDILNSLVILSCICLALGAFRIGYLHTEKNP